ncbi:MarR family winged helix-turn-helix transcriptional regulator, partial [Nocardia sp. NPDC055321]
MDFGILLGQAFHGFVAALHAHLAEHGHHVLGASYGYVLRSLDENALTASQLGERLGITAQGAAKIVDEMVGHGYVERRPDPNDKRAKLLQLSERGRATLDLVRAFHAAYERDLAARRGAGPRAAGGGVNGGIAGGPPHGGGPLGLPPRCTG